MENNADKVLIAWGASIAKASDGVLPVVDRGTPEWESWRNFRKRAGLPVGFMETSERWTVPVVIAPHDDEWRQMIAGRSAISGKASARLLT